MKEVVLKIRADADDYLKKAGEVSDVSQELSDEAQAQYEAQAEAIHLLTGELEKLQIKQGKLFAQYKASGYKKMPKDFRETGDAVAYLEKNLDALDSTQRELVESSAEMTKEETKAGESKKKSGGMANYLTSRLKRMGATMIITTLIIGTLRKILMSSERAMDQLRIKGAQTTAVINTFGKAIMSGDFKNFAKNLSDAAKGAKDLYENQKLLNALQNQAKIITADLSLEAINYKTAMDDEKKSMDERIEAANKYYDIQKQIIALEEGVRLQAFDNASKALQNNTKLTEEQLKALSANATEINNNKEKLELYIKKINELNKLDVKTVVFRKNLVKEYTDEIIGLRTELEGVFTGTPLENITSFYRTWTDSDEKLRGNFAETLAAWTGGQKDIIESEADRAKAAEAIREKEAKDEEKRLEERRKLYEEFLSAIAKLRDDYEQARLDSLTGEAAIKAQLEFQLKEIDTTQKHLESLGQLTEEHVAWLDFLRKKASDDALVELKLLHKEEQDFIVAQNREVELLAKERTDKEVQMAKERADRLSALKKEIRIGAFMLLDPDDLKKAEFQLQLLEEELQDATTKMNKEFRETGKSSEEAALQIQLIQQAIQGVQQQVDNLKAQEKFSIWKLVGLDEKLTDEEKDNIEGAFKEMIGTWAGVMDQIYAQRVADAQRNRELLDEQLKFEQDALSNEIELMKLGYANNVEAKRQEIEQLKVQREKALKDEEKAIKAQKALDTVMQVSSLVTASADIFKSLAKAGPVGVIVAIATIATMLGAFAATKIKAAQATKLAKGGFGDETGVITGRSHAQGGERFIDHIEVERGEKWGVLSRRASAKYGGLFEDVVTSLNRDKLPKMTNNVFLNVDKTNDKLDRVESQLVKLNKYFANKSDVADYGDFRIERAGNRTRIIRKNV